MERKPLRYYQVQEQKKRTEQHADPYVIARELAKDLIREYVRRGDTVHDLKTGQMGCGGPGYSAQIGGYMYRDMGKSSEQCILLQAGEIGVEQVRGVPVMQVFPLQEIYQEVKREEKDGEQIIQMTLFSQAPTSE